MLPTQRDGRRGILRLFGLTMLLALAYMSVRRSAYADTATVDIDGRGLIWDLGAKAMTIVHTRGLSHEQKERKLFELYRYYFDHERIAAKVAGRSWLRASERTRAQFDNELGGRISKFMATHLIEYDQFAILGTEVDTEGVIVYSHIRHLKTREPLNLTWYLRKYGSTFRIREVSVHGVLIVLRQQSDFKILLGKVRDSLEELIATFARPLSQVP